MFKNKADSLIMCSTPLQMLIAEKIILQNKDKVYDLLVVALNDNEKYRHYFKRLKELCNNSMYYAANSRKIAFLFYISKLRLSKLHRRYKNLYLASIDSRHFQLIISKNSKANIYTFDDGLANILSTSKYHSNNKYSSIKRLKWSILGIKYYMDDIKKLSKYHYTIYKDIPNIIDICRPINLFSSTDTAIETSNNKVIIFIGQPVGYNNPTLTNDKIANIINDLNADFYYPHPREKTIPKGNFKVINSPLIFEDYIVQYLANNPNDSIHVFSFYSSIVLNLINIDKVSMSYCCTKDLYLKYKELYDMAESKFNIPIIKV